MRLVGIFALLFSVGVACTGDKETGTVSADTDTDTDTDTDADADADTDADVDADTDTDTDADTDSDPPKDYGDNSLTVAINDVPIVGEHIEVWGEANVDAGGISGTINFESSLGKDYICDAEVDFSGAEYAGACPGCDWAFEVTSTVTSDMGTKDCWLPPWYTMIDSYRWAGPWVFAYAPSVTSGDGIWDWDYYGYISASTVLMTGYNWDLSYLGGVYTGIVYGPYWEAMYYGGKPNSTFTQKGDSMSWSVSMDYAGSPFDEGPYFSYCGYVGGGGIQNYWGTAYGLDALNCAYTEIFDVWEIDAVAGDTLSVAVDTIAADSAFDPAFLMNDTTGCTIEYADDNFPCEYNPATPYTCPAASVTADADGVYQVAVFGWSGCTGSTAEYRFQLLKE